MLLRSATVPEGRTSKHRPPGQRRKRRNVSETLVPALAFVGACLGIAAVAAFAIFVFSLWGIW